MELTIDQALKLAIEHHKAGNGNEAYRLYRAILDVMPGHPDANHNIARLMMDSSKFEEAIPFLEAALTAFPKYEQFWASYAEALNKAGRKQDALKAIKDASDLGIRSISIEIPGDRAESSIHQERQGLNDETDSGLDQFNSSPEEMRSEIAKLFNSKRYMEAERLARAFTAKTPQDAFGWKALGAVLRQMGKQAEAVSPMKLAVEIAPNDSEAHCNLGTLLFDLGRMDEAEQACRNAIKMQPNNAEAYNTLGAALKSKGKYIEAEECYRAAIALKPDHAESYNNLGNILYIQRRLDEAMANFQKAIEIKPTYAEAYCNIGVALNSIGRGEEAIAAFRNAIALKPDYADAYGYLGVALAETLRLEEARTAYLQAIAIKPNHADTYGNLGNVLGEMERYDEAEACYHKAISIDPEFALAYFNLAVLLCERGRIEEGNRNFHKAIAINSRHAEFLRAMTRYRKFKAGDSDIAMIERLYEDSSLTVKERIQTGFALAKVYEDIGKYDESFRLYTEANGLQKRELGYDIASDMKLFDAIKEAFSAGNFPYPYKNNAVHKKRYIFVVGMPRSGTTLVEQILSSHSTVFGAGELDSMNNSMMEVFGKNKNGIEFQLSKGNIEKIYLEYSKEIACMKISESVIVDKMPHNFRWLGFILLAMPDVKIVHTVRDPMATSWSIFKSFFPAKGLGFTWDLNDIADYYKMYEELMAFWHDKFPGRIYDLEYEKLTENQEEETRKLLEYCGLSWEEACLNFHETERAVKTASAGQVRNKMYKGSSEAWKKFERHLGPLKTKLGAQ